MAATRLELATARRLPALDHLPHRIRLALLGVPHVLVGLHRARSHRVPCRRDVRAWLGYHVSPLVELCPFGAVRVR